MNANFSFQIMRDAILVLLLAVVVTGCNSDDIKLSPSDEYFAEKADAGLTEVLTSATERED
ncbi:MAG: hypothetical protein AB2531_16460, partial [Candidatus Thiodiazotropha sp.]